MMVLRVASSRVVYFHRKLSGTMRMTLGNRRFMTSRSGHLSPAVGCLRNAYTYYAHCIVPRQIIRVDVGSIVGFELSDSGECVIDL